jgi:hypothetical protein
MTPDEGTRAAITQRRGRRDLTQSPVSLAADRGILVERIGMADAGRDDWLYRHATDLQPRSQKLRHESKLLLERVAALRRHIRERNPRRGLEVSRSTDTGIDSNIKPRHVVQHSDQLNG